MSNQQFPTLPAPLKRVIAGAEFLDGVEPGWVDLLDVSQLDIALNDWCVLGQLGKCLDPDWSDRLGVYHVAIDAYGLDTVQLLEFGFTGELAEIQTLTSAWVLVIQARRCTAAIAQRYGVDDVEPVVLAERVAELVGA